jgi:DNA-binding protein H-NS
LYRTRGCAVSMAGHIRDDLPLHAEDDAWEFIHNFVAILSDALQKIRREMRMQQRETPMARNGDVDKMSYAELAAMETRIARLKNEKQNAERLELRQKLTDMAKQHGFDIHELFGKGRKGKGSVAVKYRDPKNRENTWTGRGRMPRWMAAATKGGKAKKEDFLV